MEEIITKAVAGGLVALAYPDLLKPTAQQVGTTLGRVVGVALAPLRGVVWGFGQVQEWLSGKLEEKLKDIPPERIVFPEPTVAVPALLALSYSMHQEALREMYARLLATAMDQATKTDVHPSFVEVIKQLTPDEARVVSFLSKEEALFYDLYAYSPDIKSHASDEVGVTDLFERAHCQDLEHTQVAISNLERQGLALFEPRAFSEPQLPTALERLNEVQVLRPHFERIRKTGRDPTAAIRAFRLTAFGRSFCKCCVEG